MSKNFFQDVVPPERRSIRNVPIMGGRNRKKMPTYDESPDPAPEPRAEEPVQRFTDSGPAFPKPKKKKSRGRVLGAFAVLLIAGFIFSMMTLFTSAKIDIVPKKETVTFNVALKAEKNPAPGSTALRYEVIEVKQENEVEVPASGEEIAENKASGTIIISNNFSEESQRLIARTRFESPNGLIFRIAESIVVPGKTASGPGIIEAVVYADEAGDKYNLDKSDFTIPGFKSDNERYKGFSAKSKTDMTGGFVGKVKKVSEADKKAAMERLEGTLKEELEKSAISQVPEGFTSINGSTIYEFKDLGQIESSGSTAILKIEGSAQKVAFDKSSLASIVATQFLPDWKSQGVLAEIRDFQGLSVSFEPGFNISADTLPLKFSGTADVFAAINGITISESLRGKSKTSLDDIMGQFGGISTAKATVRPIWKSTFPENTAKIHINIQ